MASVASKGKGKRSRAHGNDDPPGDGPPVDAPTRRSTRCSTRSSLGVGGASQPTAESNERRLSKFWRAARSGSPCAWTNADLREMFLPLEGVPPERWHAALADPAVELLSLGTVADPDSSFYAELEARVFAYTSLVSGAGDGCGGVDTSRTVPVDSILPLVAAARAKRDWRKDSGVVSDFVRLFRGAAAISLAGGSEAAVESWQGFSEEWYSHVESIPALRGALDPVYVVVKDASVVPHGGWPVVTPQMAAVVGGAPAVVDGSASVRSFPSIKAAVFWCGMMKERFQNQMLVIINAGVRVAEIL